MSTVLNLNGSLVIIHYRACWCAPIQLKMCTFLCIFKLFFIIYIVLFQCVNKRYSNPTLSAIFLQAPDFSGAFLRIGRSPHPSPGEPDHVTIGMRFCASSSSRFGGQAGADTAELGSFTCAGQKCLREENTWRHCLICRKG